jgi:hypothetical protein
MPDDRDKLQGESRLLSYRRDNGNRGESLLRRWLCSAAGDSTIYSPQHKRFILFFPDAETANTTSTLFPQMLQRWILPFASALAETSVFDFPFSAMLIPPFRV